MKAELTIKNTAKNKTLAKELQGMVCCTWYSIGGEIIINIDSQMNEQQLRAIIHDVKVLAD